MITNEDWSQKNKRFSVPAIENLCNVVFIDVWYM